MNFSINRVSVYSLIVLISLSSFSFAQSKLPSDLGTEVKILGGIGGKRLNCFPTNKLVVTKAEFEKLLNDEKCSILEAFEVDFSTHTLINYSVGGDCRMSVTHKVFRNDKTKTYTIEVKNYWGRCRAGGSYHSWIVIDKTPTGYIVELTEDKIDDIRKENDSSLSVMSNNITKRLSSITFIESKQVDLNGCIPMYRQQQYVIKDKEYYLKNIRIDAKTEQCKNNVKNLGFEKYSYLGLKIHSGYCRYPKGLEYKFMQDNPNKQYVLTVSYTDPEGQVCRAFSQYDLWLQVPKLIGDFEVIFQITPKPRSNKSSKH